MRMVDAREPLNRVGPVLAVHLLAELVSKHGSNHTVLRTLASLIFGYQAPESSSE
jgi:hypothetical protein